MFLFDDSLCLFQTVVAFGTVVVFIYLHKSDAQ